VSRPVPAPSSSPIPGHPTTTVLGQGKPSGGTELAEPGLWPCQQDLGSGWGDFHLCPAVFWGEDATASLWKPWRDSWRLLESIPFPSHIFSHGHIIPSGENPASASSPAAPVSPRPPVHAPQPRRRHLPTQEGMLGERRWKMGSPVRSDQP